MGNRCLIAYESKKDNKIKAIYSQWGATNFKQFFKEQKINYDFIEKLVNCVYTIQGISDFSFLFENPIIFEIIVKTKEKKGKNYQVSLENVYLKDDENNIIDIDFSKLEWIDLNDEKKWHRTKQQFFEFANKIELAQYIDTSLMMMSAYLMIDEKWSFYKSRTKNLDYEVQNLFKEI